MHKITMNNNPKFNWLIRFSLEVFVIIAGVALALSRSGEGAPPAERQHPPRDQPGHGIGTGGNVATVTVQASQGTVQYLGRTLPLREAIEKLTAEEPEHLVIKLRGSEWKALLDWAIQQDKSVSVAAE